MTYDEALAIEAARMPAVRLVHAGDSLCPECHHTYGRAQIGHCVILYCREHRVWWRAGWLEDADRGEQRGIWDGVGLANYREVEPHWELNPTFSKNAWEE